MESQTGGGAGAVMVACDYIPDSKNVTNLKPYQRHSKVLINTHVYPFLLKHITFKMLTG